MHLALLVSIFFINGADMDEAKALDKDWFNKIKSIDRQELKDAGVVFSQLGDFQVLEDCSRMIDSTQHSLIFLHAAILCVCSYRELNGVAVNTFG